MIIFETDRMILRHLELRDLDRLYEMYRDEETRRYFPDGTLTYEQTKEELEWFLKGHPRRPELGLWAMDLKETGALVGRSGLLPWNAGSVEEVEVAYLVAKEYWGQGLGTEAAQAVLNYGFHQLGLPKLVCYIYPDNRASVRVAEKIGMTFEREETDEAGLYRVYSQLNREVP